LFGCLSLDGSSSKRRKSDKDGSFVDEKFSEESDESCVGINKTEIMVVWKSTFDSS
jgi:hypothetical protein